MAKTFIVEHKLGRWMDFLCIADGFTSKDEALKFVTDGQENNELTVEGTYRIRSIESRLPEVEL